MATGGTTRKAWPGTQHSCLSTPCRSGWERSGVIPSFGPRLLGAATCFDDVTPFLLRLCMYAGWQVYVVDSYSVGFGPAGAVLPYMWLAFLLSSGWPAGVLVLQRGGTDDSELYVACCA